MTTQTITHPGLECDECLAPANPWEITDPNVETWHRTLCDPCAARINQGDIRRAVQADVTAEADEGGASSRTRGYHACWTSHHEHVELHRQEVMS